MYKTWVRTSLLNLILSTSIGALLRFAFVQEVPGLQYKYFLHAHSHVAMLGWVYLILFSGFVLSFLAEEQRKKTYPTLFWLTQASVMGMLISFPLQGYGLFSIIFLVVHTLLSYWFTYKFIHDVQKNKDNSLSTNFAKTALVLMVLSLFGIWLLGYTMATEGKSGSAYYLSIQFFLHFQFNGWFIFGGLALFFKMLEQQAITFSPLRTKQFFWLLFVSCLLTFFISIAWATGSAWAIWINGLGVVIQLFAAIIFVQLVKGVALKNIMGFWPRLLFGFAYACFLLKIGIQVFLIIPEVAEISFVIRNYTIAFIHLIFLGIVTMFILGFNFYKKALNIHKKRAQLGVALLITGLILSELILFSQGTMFWMQLGFMPYYYLSLFAASALMPLGFLLVLL